MTVLGLLTTTYGAPSAREDLESLLLGVAAGDSHSLEELYHRTRTAVYGLVLSYLKHPQDAEDVTQDAFVRIWDTAASYRPQGKPMAWLLTVARNLALMRLRERGKTQELTDEEWSALPARAPDVTTEDRHVLRAALSVLSEQERQVVMLHAVTGLKHREIAQLLELPPEDCAGVDDALAGVESARTAGMTAAAIGPAALAGAGDWNLECLSRLLDLCQPLEGGRDL